MLHGWGGVQSKFVLWPVTPPVTPHVWITGPGRSGTTLFTRCCEALGCKLGTGGTEDGELVRANDALKEALYGDDEVAAARWYKEPPSTPEGRPSPLVLDRMAKAAETIPLCCKDPRWSLTMPWWLDRLNSAWLPEHIVVVDREAVSCAVSWTRQAEEFDQALEAVMDRQRRLEQLAERALDQGFRVHRLTYPDYARSPGDQLHPVLGELFWDTPQERIVQAVAERVNLESIHDYTKKDLRVS